MLKQTAGAILAAAQGKELSLVDVQDFDAPTGKGVMGSVSVRTPTASQTASAKASTASAASHLVGLSQSISSKQPWRTSAKAMPSDGF